MPPVGQKTRGGGPVLAFPPSGKIFGLHDAVNSQYVLDSEGHAYFLMKRRTRSWLRLTLLVLLVGGVYLVMRNFEQQFVYAPSTYIKKTPRQAKLPFDNIALATDVAGQVYPSRV